MIKCYEKNQKKNEVTEEDELIYHLRMEEEIKTKNFKCFNPNKNYLKFKKSKRKFRMNIIRKELSVSKNKNFKKIQTILVDNFKNLQ